MENPPFVDVQTGKPMDFPELFCWMVYDDQLVIFLMIEHTLDLHDFKALGNTI